MPPKLIRYQKDVADNDTSVTDVVMAFKFLTLETFITFFIALKSSVDYIWTQFFFYLMGLEKNVKYQDKGQQ